MLTLLPPSRVFTHVHEPTRRSLQPLTVALIGCVLAGQATLAPVVAGPLFAAARTTVSGQGPAEAYGKLAMTFEPNVGQAPDDVRFVARGDRYRVFLNDSGATLSLRTHADGGRLASIALRFIGAQPGRAATGMEPGSTSVNYFLGNDPSKWRSDVPTYAKVRYSDVYPGVDVVWYGKQGHLEYDFVVAPGASTDAIAVAYEGADRLTVDRDGALVLRVSGSAIRQLAPAAYQEIRGKRVTVETHYVLSGREIRLAVGSYDRTLPLTIDPIVAYSTFLGGTGSESVTGIAVDPNGNAFVTGTTISTDFPTTRTKIGSGTPGGPEDVFVSKLNATGTALLYSAYIGGSSNDEAFAIAIDGTGRAYVTGSTTSTDFPHTTNGIVPDTDGLDVGNHAFIVMIDPSQVAASQLRYSGRFDATFGTAIAVWHDGAANKDYAYIVGETASLYYPTTSNAFDQVCGADAYCSGGPDAFFMKLLPDNTLTVADQIKYSTVLGGTATGSLPSDYLFDDRAYGVAVDSAGRAFVTGETKTTDFPTTAGAYDPYCGTDTAHDCSPSGGLGTYDAFLSKIDPSLTGVASLVYSTYLGGSGDDDGRAVAVDATGRAVVTGSTTSANFPTTTGAFDRSCGSDGACNGGSDAFVAVFNTSLTGVSSLSSSTFYGGSGDEVGTGVAVDTATGAIHFTGTTSSDNLPLASAIVRVRLSESDLRDIYVARIAPALDVLEFSSYFGSVGDEAAYFFAFESHPVFVLMPKIAVVSSTGAAYVGGVATFDDFPFTNTTYDKVCGSEPTGGGCYGSSDGFVMKISPQAMNDYCPAPAGALVAAAGDADPHQVIVKFKSGVSAVSQTQILSSEVGAERVTALPLIGAQLVRDPARSAVSLAQELGARPDVQYAVLDGYVHETGYPDEPDFAKQWGLHNTGQVIPHDSTDPDNVGIADRDIDGLEAAQVTLGSASTVVAVIDSGVDFTHPDLNGQQWLNPGESGGGKETNGIDDDHNGYIDDVVGWDFVNDDKTVYDATAQSDHGTVVAGILAARINGQGIVGVAPNVRVMALKVLGGTAGTGKDSDFIKAVQYATAKGVRIANASLGSNVCNPAVKEALQAASSMLLVASAGNGGADDWRDNNDIAPEYPASYDVDTIISVAAVDNRGRLADFSNWGYRNVDVAAPGVNIFSTTANHGWNYDSGTSMAAPFVAGVAALATSINPGISVAQLRQLILTTGMSLPTLTNRIATGKLVNARAVLDGAPGTPPTAPLNASAVAGNASATVSWQAPVSNGSSPITSYTATSAPGGKTCTTPNGTTLTCTVSGLTNGTPYTFTVRAANAAGQGTASAQSNSVIPHATTDTAPPIVAAPAGTILGAQTLGATAKVRLSWSATDASGVAKYELQTKKGTGLWTPVVLSPVTATSADIALTVGASYVFRLRATDGVGNTSAWSTTTASKLRLVQENATTILYTGTWNRVAMTGASGGYVKYATTAGAKARLTFTGTGASFVSTVSPARGIAQVWIDGSLAATIDTYSISTTKKRIVYATPRLTYGTHTIEIRLTGTKRAAATAVRVDVDAFLTWP